MSRVAFETVQELEFNAWPDLLSVQRNGWRIRIGGGFTGRANSVTALIAGADLGLSDLSDIEEIYRRHDLPTIIRITPLVASGLDERLATSGYQPKNPSEFRSVVLNPALAHDASVDIAARPPAGWVEAFGRLNGRNDFNPMTMAAILGRIVLPAGYAQLVEDGMVCAIGLGVVDRGLMEVQSIAVDPNSRGRGLGRKLVESLMAWGHAQGARQAILSVAASNVPAVRLYKGLGFEVFGGYHYRVKTAP